ncbi:amidohydrolase family protein [Arthrobacter sp.]|uniref:amidohydrolase family protein n=1 Tax=Arthrobacter sp. TaxID=1667 RepID=UPI003A93BF07
MPDLLVKNVRPWGGPATDLLITDGAVSRTGTPAPGTPVLDGGGRLALPSFSDVHVHLDSTRLGLPFRPHSGAPGVWPMVMNDRKNWRNDPESAEERATRTLGLMIERGVTRVRSYAQIDVDCGLERFHAVQAAAQAHRDRCDVQIIAFPQAGLLREAGTIPLMRQALDEGADWVGGIDPCTLDRDPKGHLDALFSLAEEFQVPVDVHLHEPGHLGVFSTDLILERVRALGMHGQLTMSHSYDLGGVNEATTRRLVEEFAELDVSMATVAPAQQRGLPLVDLVQAGVRVGLGEDGQRDFWSPYGNADMLDRTWQLAFTHQFRADELIEHCVAIATRGGASIMSAQVPRVSSVADRPGLADGDAGDLVLVSGDTVTAAVMDRLPDRTVVHAGRVVADGLQLT